MKRSTLLAVLAVVGIVITAIAYNPMVLVALVFLVIAYIVTEKVLPKPGKASAGPMDAASAAMAYGEPDDVIVTDATRANEPTGSILVYLDRGILLVAGEPVNIDDIIDVASVNTATPYTVGQYQVVLTTRDKRRQYVRIDVGYDGEWAMGVAEQVIDAVKMRQARRP